MKINKNIDILMLDKNYLQLAMSKDIPGLDGVKETEKTIPGLDGVEETEEADDTEEETEEFKKGFMSGYAAGLNDSMSSNGITTKKEKQSIKGLFKLITSKMFGGNTSNNLSVPIYSEQNGVSIIDISGLIGKHLDYSQKQSGYVDVDDIAKALKISKSANTQAVILKIHSPGGTSIGVSETGILIKELTEIKPVFTFSDTICASAAYWLASCSNGIYVTPSAEIGSVGVITKVVDYTEKLKMDGITVKIFTGGDMKSMGHGDISLTDKQSDFITNEVNEQTVKFRELVNDNRGGVNEECMQGQLFSGEKAIECNLADEVVPDYETFFEQITKE